MPLAPVSNHPKLNAKDTRVIVVSIGKGLNDFNSLCNKVRVVIIRGQFRSILPQSHIIKKPVGSIGSFTPVTIETDYQVALRTAGTVQDRFDGIPVENIFLGLNNVPWQVLKSNRGPAVILPPTAIPTLQRVLFRAIICRRVDRGQTCYFAPITS